MTCQRNKVQTFFFFFFQYLLSPDGPLLHLISLLPFGPFLSYTPPLSLFFSCSPFCNHHPSLGLFTSLSNASLVLLIHLYFKLYLLAVIVCVSVCGCVMRLKVPVYQGFALSTCNKQLSVLNNVLSNFYFYFYSFFAHAYMQ